MQVTINEIDIEIPFDPELITLTEFIDWHNQSGRRLNEELMQILDNKDLNDVDRMAQVDDHLDDEAMEWFCFWTKTQKDDANAQPNIIQYLDKYRVLRSLLNNNDFEFPYEVEWQGERWQIVDFKLNPASEMSFNEIITSKEVMRQVYKIGQDNWSGLPYLCCVYFRRKGEAFEDAFIHEGAERMELFKNLPLKHAFAVAFFLNICVNIWSNTLAYSRKEVEETVSLR